MKNGIYDFEREKAVFVAGTSGAGKTAALETLTAILKRRGLKLIEIGDQREFKAAARRARGSERLGRDESGMTLIELLLVIVIVGILATFAVMSLSSTVQLNKDSMQRTRLAQVAEAEMRYREMSASRSFAKTCDLTKKITPDGLLVAESVAKFDSACTPQAISDWIIADNPSITPTAAYLKSDFSIVIYKASKPDVMFCVHADGVMRRGTYSGGCTRTSETVE